MVAERRCSRDQVFPIGDHESAIWRQHTRTLGEVSSGVFTVFVLVTLSQQVDEYEFLAAQRVLEVHAEYPVAQEFVGLAVKIERFDLNAGSVIIDFLRMGKINKHLFEGCVRPVHLKRIVDPVSVGVSVGRTEED